MAKNEAKIKFTAETGDFNDAIKKSNNQMTELRAEMKLNETQMQNTGVSAEKLGRKHKILQDQLKAAQEKTDALSNKLRVAEKYFGGNSDEASKLRTQLTNAKNAQERLSKAVDDCADEMKSFERNTGKAGKAARDASADFGVATAAVGDFISDMAQAGLEKMGEFVDYIGGLPEETREARQGMAILGTSFEEAGLSAEQGQELVRDLYGVLGDNDRAVEASTLIAKMARNQHDLNDWALISTGIFGTYGESLPVEALAEAANETAKTGTVTGGLADALNWSSDAAAMFSKYMNEDVTTAEDAFNVALSKCSSEQERQALITETLTALYGDAALNYKDAAGGMIDANTAAYDLAQTEAQAAEAVEPVTTAWDGLKNQLLTACLPAIESIAGGLEKVFGWLQEHPAVLNIVTAALGAFAVAVGVMAAAWGVYTIYQMAANAAMLPTIGIALLVAVGIAALVAAGVALYQNWDTVCAWASEKWTAIKESVSTAVESAKLAIGNAWDTVKTWTSEKFEAVKTSAVEKWESIKTSLSEKIEGIKTKVSDTWENIKTAASEKWEGIKSAITTPIENAKTKVSEVIDAIKGFFDFEFSWPHIPLPHFGITPSGWQVGDLLKGSIPTLGVEWYAKGGIMTKPTVFGVNGNKAMVGGEAGAEAILPIDRLEGYISDVMDRKLAGLNLDALADSIEDLASRPVVVSVNGRELMTATASDGDSVNGLRSTFKSRGLALG